MANPTLRTFLNGRYTRKQVYDFVLASIVAQGRPGSEETSWGNSVCVYRGDDGVKCGVGHLVTNTDLKEAAKINGAYSSANNSAIHDLMSDLDLLDKSNKEDKHFLESIQATHDDADSFATKKHKRGSVAFNKAFISEFKRGMKALKKEYNLKD